MYYFILMMTIITVSFSSYAEIPANLDKNQFESDVLKKFISLESEGDHFYRINEIDIIETEDPYYHRPGLMTQINYSTPQCKNNYFRGTTYFDHCEEKSCAFAMTYKNCF